MANFSLSLDVKNKTLLAHANAAIAKMTTDAESYINQNDFKNLQPKVGYLEEKVYPIYATYNMSYEPCDLNPSWAISDAAGREIVYTLASDGQVTSPLKVYRAYRFNSSEEFTFENTDIRPAYLASDKYVNAIIGIGCEWIAYQCSDSTYHFVITNGQSYDKWTTYKDISSIISGTIHNILYFPEAGTIGVFALSGLNREMRLFKYDDLSLIKTVPLFDGVIAPGTYSVSSTNNRFYGTLIYNKTMKQLIMVTGYITWIVNSSYVCYKVVNAWSIDTNFLSTGTGTFIPLFTDSDIAVNSGNAVYANFNDSIRGYFDEYEKVIRYMNKPQDAYYEYIHKVPGVTPLTSKDIFAGQLSNTYFTTPDACPWAKRTRSPIYAMEGNLYFNADSKSSGSSHIYTNYFKTYDANGFLNLVPGKWWRANGIEDGVFQSDSFRLVQCQRVDETTTKWQGIWSWGGAIKEVSFGQTTRDGMTMNGFRTLSPSIKTMPLLPADYISTGIYPTYDNVRNKVLGIVAKPNGDWPKLILLEYDFATGDYTEYDTMPTAIVNEQTTQHTRMHTFSGSYIISYSNALIDLDGTIYLAIRFEQGGYADTFALIIAPDRTITTGSNPGAYYGSKSFGYDPIFGYYKCTQEGGYYNETMYHTKDITGIGAEKTIADFKTTSLYKTKVGPKSAVGLIAYTQKTPMLANGKCKTIGSVGVNLYPSADNYVFVVGKDDAFKIEARLSDALLPGESRFNTVLIAKVVTNDSDPLSIEYYDI